MSRFQIFFLIIAFTFVGVGMYLFFLNRERHEVGLGVGFDWRYAEWLGLDWKKSYLAMLNDLKPKYIRLPVPWDSVEKTQGKFVFSDIDWQVAEAGKRNVKVVLVVGQKVPRWPECHIPEWAAKKQDIARTRTFEYIRKVVEHFQKNTALEYWQVENEPFIRFEFGNCKYFHGEIVDQEIKLVRSLDPAHKIIVTDSGEMGLWWRASRAGDILGTTVYRKVRSYYDMVVPYFWMPPVNYRLKAWILGRGVKNMMVMELQAEPWFGQDELQNIIAAKQEKTMNPAQLKKNIEFVRHIGVSRAYLWGSEWWYWMKEVKKDSRYWEAVKDELNP